MSKKPNINDIIAQLKQALSTNGSYTQPKQMNVIKPQMMDMNSLYSQLGMDVPDKAKIQAAYKAAADAAYQASLDAQNNSEKSFIQGLAGIQNSAVDTVRDTMGTGAMNGASQGMQAANTLSAILGTQQSSVDSLNKLIDNRNLIGSTYGANLTTGAKDANTYYDTLQQAAMGISRQAYADQIQQQTAELGYNTALNTDSAGYGASWDSTVADLIAALTANGYDTGSYNSSYSGGGYDNSAGSYTTPTNASNPQVLAAQQLAQSQRNSEATARDNAYMRSNVQPGMVNGVLYKTQPNVNPNINGIQLNALDPRLQQIAAQVLADDENNNKRKNKLNITAIRSPGLSSTKKVQTQTVLPKVAVKLLNPTQTAKSATPSAASNLAAKVTAQTQAQQSARARQQQIAQQQAQQAAARQQATLSSMASTARNQASASSNKTYVSSNKSNTQYNTAQAAQQAAQASAARQQAIASAKAAAQRSQDAARAAQAQVQARSQQQAAQVAAANALAKKQKAAQQAAQNAAYKR